MEQVKIPAHLAEKAQTSIDELFEKLVGVQALVVASIDGFAVASKSIVEVDAKNRSHGQLLLLAGGGCCARKLIGQ